MKAVIFVFCLLLPSPLLSATLKFQYPPEHEQWIDGFAVFQKVDGAAVERWRTTEKSRRDFDNVDLGPKVQVEEYFFIAPFSKGKVGPYSDIFTVYPDQLVPPDPEEIFIPLDRVTGITIKK